MICILTIIHLLAVSHALQTGYTCESLVKLTCPQSKKLVILEVSYSTACKNQSSSDYAPSRCIARHREPTGSKCNGLETCTIDNYPSKNPSFNVNLDANCAFQGQSINIEYSCIQHDKNDLPSIDICSSKRIGSIREGFIHSPNYPKDYGANLNCEKTISVPEIGHRLKIYAIRLNTKSVISLSAKGPKRIDDWLEINDNGEKITSLARQSYSLLYDDVIDVNLKFKTEAITSKQDVIGFLLYFIVVPIRRSRPTSKITDGGNEGQNSALIIDKKDKQSNIALILIITLLVGVLLILIVGFFIYKRGADRRVRYLEDAFHSFDPENSKEKFVEEMKEFSSSSSADKSEHIYSEDPLTQSPLYERIDDFDTTKSKEIAV